VVTPTEAVERALRHVGKGTYALGAGDFHADRPDSPWTSKPPSYEYGCDCWGYAHSYAYKTSRHRPGFNKGPWATVSDDINCDSAIEDAEHKRELFELVDTPRIGDLLVWPSIRGPDRKRIRIGHVSIVVDVPAEWDVAAPQFGLLIVVQCSPGGTAAIKRGPATGFMARESFRGFIDHAWRTRILRVRAA